jgi:hypothetical protein
LLSVEFEDDVETLIFIIIINIYYNKNIYYYFFNTFGEVIALLLHEREPQVVLKTEPRTLRPSCGLFLNTKIIPKINNNKTIIPITI